MARAKPVGPVEMSQFSGLARTSQLRHRGLGITIETPLLVPSFSSKGFGVSRAREVGGVETERSEIAEILRVASEYLTDSMLLSAYDIHYEHVPLPAGAVTDITIVDSGGYETSDLQDLSTTFIHAVAAKEWNEALHQEVLARWPSHVPAIFVSYDDARERLPLEDQIEKARQLFRRHPDHLSAILIKPERPRQAYVQVGRVIGQVEELRSFDVVGFTEKELGGSFLDRMVNLAKIRLAMDDANVDAPIHVFGSLDPISIPLYFVAGAEIFDGLTWLRYGYDKGMAVYRHNFAAKHIGLSRRDDFVKLKTLQENLGVLVDLTNQMRKFVVDPQYDRFGPNADVVRDAVDLLKTKIRRVA